MGVIMSIDVHTITECRDKLLSEKERLLNQRSSQKRDLARFEFGGDEADQSMRMIDEQSSLQHMERLRLKIFEIDQALLRIQTGDFGFCEETGELIEVDRLKAIPWTRLSIEGAEIREAQDKRYAR